jgi:hypothetical protein
MFLTTNNVKKFDDAMWSRLDFMKQYPPLSENSRLRLWELFLGRIDRSVGFNCAKRQIRDLARKNLNGREVRSN